MKRNGLISELCKSDSDRRKDPSMKSNKGKYQGRQDGGVEEDKTRVEVW